jgi:hypothetical protein
MNNTTISKRRRLRRLWKSYAKDSQLNSKITWSIAEDSNLRKTLTISILLGYLKNVWTGMDSI